VFVNTFVNVQADPYIQVRLGPTKIDTADDYVPNTLNPVFGKWVTADWFMQLCAAEVMQYYYTRNDVNRSYN